MAWIPDSRYWIPDFVNRIPIVSGISDSKAKDYSFGHKQKSSGFLNFLCPGVRSPESEPLRKAKIQTTFSLSCRQKISPYIPSMIRPDKVESYMT